MRFPKLSSPAVLSPMAGVTDVAFRALAKKYGAGLTCTEFVSGTALVRGSEKAQRMILTDPSEKPVAVQLFGGSVQDVVQAAQAIQDTFDVIDVNCGCPAWKVIKTGAGSEMLKNPKHIGLFVRELVANVRKPVTVKIRIGIDDQRINAVEVAKIVEDAGAAAIAVHGRTQQQGYSGNANWNVIKKVKDVVSIPVIGNGDVFTPETFKQRLEESGVDAIMIARGAVGNPYIFTQINDFLKTGAYSPGDRLNDFQEYLALAQRYKIPFADIQRHAVSFTKTLRNGAAVRRELAKCKTLEALQTALNALQSASS